jgi:DNA repair exonuclease SbcCD ATPase subunit
MPRELSFYKKHIEHTCNKLSLLRERSESLAIEEERLCAKMEDVEKAQVFIQTVAKETQDQLKIHLQDIVQLALDSVFPDEFEFAVEFEIKNGRTEASLLFMDSGQPIEPMDAAGGGVSDIVSFALRFAVWSLGNSEPFIILDEPFKNIDATRQPKAKQILKRLVEKLKLQVIMITHDLDMINYSDRVFRVNREKYMDWKKSVVKVED